MIFKKKTGLDSDKIKRKGLIKSFNVLMFQVIPGGGGGITRLLRYLQKT